MRHGRVTKTLIDYLKQYGTGPRGVSGVGVKSIFDLRGKVLVIAEKPKAARKIAEALAKDFPVKRQHRYKGIPYWVLEKTGLKVYVAPAAGHLYGLTTDERGYPTFTYSWKPLYLIEKESSYTRKYLELLERLCSEADYYINACDYDIEGSVIGYMIIKHCGDLNRSFRVKFSSLTEAELRSSFRNLMPLDKDMIEAGLCRHELDWIWGINVSRALMDSVYHASGKKIILSAGRVQTPTLKYVVEREIERNLFIPLPQYTLSVTIVVGGRGYNLEYKGTIMDRRSDAVSRAQYIRSCGYLVVSDYKEAVKRLTPPPPFNLGDLQEEAARIYGFSPHKTQTIAEQLYLNAYISYPRTNSQKLPPTLDYMGILRSLSKIPEYRGLIDTLIKETKGFLKPIEGPKEDPAHPAIYPTGVIPEDLRPDERKIYDLIVRRFLAAFAPKAVIALRSIEFKAPGYQDLLFGLSGQKILYSGWLKYYIFHEIKESEVPRLVIGERIVVSSVRIRRVFTKPPEKPSKIKILRWMEENNIGTESTRARIIELLFDRRYLKSSSGRAEATDLGLGLIEVVSEYFNELTSVDLTRKFEIYMDEIRSGKRRREEVLGEAKKTLLRLLEKFDERKGEIGLKLSWGLGALRPPRQCIICGREIFDEELELCKYHYEALNKIREYYDEWRRREGVSWSEYLSELKRLRSTGKWIRDVIEYGIV